VEPPNTLIKLIRSTIGDDNIKPIQVKNALKRLLTQTSEVEISSNYESEVETMSVDSVEFRGKEYSENHHKKGKPQEVLELFRTIDKFCIELAPNDVKRRYLSKYVRYSHFKNIFCCVHLQKSGLRVWLKLKYSDLENPPEYVRDVSNIGHWGVGNVELAIDSLERFQYAKFLIQKSLMNIKEK